MNICCGTALPASFMPQLRIVRKNASHLNRLSTVKQRFFTSVNLLEVIGSLGCKNSILAPHFSSELLVMDSKPIHHLLRLILLWVLADRHGFFKRETSVSKLRQREVYLILGEFTQQSVHMRFLIERLLEQIRRFIITQLPCEAANCSIASPQSRNV